MSNYNTLKDRLLKKIIKDPITGCWLFMGARDSSGYGNIDVNGNMISTHRVSAHLYLGMPFDSIYHVLHKDELCPYRHCCNPDHIYLGDQADNYNDSVRKGTHNQTRKKCCPKCGGAYSIKRTNGGLSLERYCKKCTRRNFLVRKFRRK